MRQFSSKDSGSEFGVNMPARIVMEGFMTVPVNVTMKVNCQYPDLLAITVTHSSFTHRFSSSLRQLSDGRNAPMLSCNSSIRPVANSVSIQAHSWHWQIPIQIERIYIDDFLNAARNFLKHA